MAPALIFMTALLVRAMRLCHLSFLLVVKVYGLARWLRGKESACSAGLDSWVRKVPWRRKRQPSPVFLPGKSHRWRSLAAYSPKGHKETRLSTISCLKGWEDMVSFPY